MSKLVKSTATKALAIYETEDKKGKGLWISTSEASLGLELNPNESSQYVGFSVHHNKFNKLAHGICLYVDKEGRPMLQASDNNRVEQINLLDMISFIKSQMPKKEGDE
jgi:hypothetical protein